MLISTYGLTSIPDKHMRLLTRLYGMKPCKLETWGGGGRERET